MCSSLSLVALLHVGCHYTSIQKSKSSISPSGNHIYGFQWQKWDFSCVLIYTDGFISVVVFLFSFFSSSSLGRGQRLDREKAKKIHTGHPYFVCIAAEDNLDWCKR